MVVLTLDVSLIVRDDAVGAGSACLRRHHGSWFPLAPSGRGDQLGAQLGSQIGISSNSPSISLCQSAARCKPSSSQGSVCNSECQVKAKQPSRQAYIRTGSNTDLSFKLVLSVCHWSDCCLSARRFSTVLYRTNNTT